MYFQHFNAVLALGLAASGAVVPASAEVPTYGLEIVATLSVPTSVRGYSEAGHVVGDQIINGVPRAFVARSGDGIQILPLPEGYVSGTAFDVNSSGVIVGTVAVNGFAFDLGEPAIWLPDDLGGYSVIIPEQFTVLPSPLGGFLGVEGGQAIAINEVGTVVGFSRYQGFGGGPATRFSLDSPPVDLGALGFAATPTDINDQNIACGGQVVFDLDTGIATDIGVPEPLQPGNVSFTNSIAFAINNQDEAVVAADLASLATENYLTYTWTPSGGFERLNPEQAPSRFVGFYDNNDRGDISASGGVLFRDEGVLLPDYSSLLDESALGWSIGLGFIANDRRVYTTAFNSGQDTNAIVVLVPQLCPADINRDGVLTGADFNAFVSAFSAGDLRADQNNDGVLTGADFNAFLTNFSAGCD